MNQENLNLKLIKRIKEKKGYSSIEKKSDMDILLDLYNMEEEIRIERVVLWSVIGILITLIFLMLVVVPKFII